MKLRFLSLIFLALTIALGFWVEQSSFIPLITLYSLFFALYLYVYHKAKDPKTLKWFIATGILLRIALIFALPNLSDDIYRFVWDGRLIINGINPFDELPSYYLLPENAVQGLDQALYNELNSQAYFTIYPPICQSIFAVSCYLFPTNILAASIFMKIILALFEIGSIFLLIDLMKRFANQSPGSILNAEQPLRNVLLYALNPLIILEISGNLHFEGPMIFFLLLSLWFLFKNRNALSAVAMALSVASKLLPLIFLPFLIFRLGWKKAIQYFVVLGMVILVLFFPLINGVFIENFGKSLNLYFQRFEFNASIYYVLRWLGFQLKGYNIIGTLGPSLAVLVFLSILYKVYKEARPNLWNLPVVMLIGISIYLFLTTTVHPWYLALPLVLCLFTKYRFPILWSLLIFGTYINYSYAEYFENLWVVAIEYLVVFIFLIREILINDEKAMLKT